MYRCVIIIISLHYYSYILYSNYIQPFFHIYIYILDIIYLYSYIYILYYSILRDFKRAPTETPLGNELVFYFYLLSVIKRDLFCRHMFWIVFHFRRSFTTALSTFVFRALESITLTELIFINLSLENSFKALFCIKVVKIIGS